MEDEDWDYARNKQIILKSAMGEWSSSVFSSEIFVNDERFVGPNRDYPLQGLITFYNRKILKLIDGIFFSLDKGLGEKVLIGPYDAKYIYHDLEVTFGFNEECFRISFNKENCRILPLFEGYIHYNIMGEWVTIKLNDLNFNFGPFKHVEKVNYRTEWIYKLGYGFRYRGYDGTIRFVREKKDLFAPLVCTLRGNLLKIYIDNMRDPWKIRESNWVNKLIFFNELIGKLIIYRLSTLRCFGLNIDGIWFPEAGCWWFRSPWIRDALEGILSNFQVYTRIFGWEDKIRSLAIFLLKLLKDNKGLPNFLGGTEESADSPPLLIYLSSRLGIKVDELTLEILKEMEKREVVENGKPILKDGLIACIPYQSWTDSRINGRPLRVPEEWKDWNFPKYLLPEVNGYWIMALRSLYRITSNKNIKEILEEIELEFKRKFWNEGFLSDIIDVENNSRSNEITSMGLVGLASTMHLFSEKELMLAFKNLKPLIVYRTMKVLGNQTLPFGVAITKKISPYLGDEEYHKSTIWPRDTPYLIKFLERIDKEEEINGILLNNLDHMVSEGAIFYINEIFGHAVGKNPFPKSIDMNPIPLKNPAQYWSHWCDPYLGRFMRER